MSSRASDLWLEELTDAAEVDGEVVHAAVTIDLDIPSVVTVTRRFADDDRPQGVAIDTDAPMSVDDTESTSIVLWSDTAPETVDVFVPPGRMTIWNVWRDDGAVQAWIGHAGIRRIELDDADSDFGLRLVASDGHDDTDPDLEVEIRINGDRGGRHIDEEE